MPPRGIGLGRNLSLSGELFRTNCHSHRDNGVDIANCVRKRKWIVELQKTYSESDQIGEEGQRLVALTVTQLGHIWHDRRIDHGIDGQIELVDPLSRAASNIQVMVQSKATDREFPSETESSFHFLLDPADVAYWQGGDSKVIVVCSRPRDGLTWWAPVERAEPPRRDRKSWRLEFDKESDRLDEDSIGRLLLWASDATPGLAIDGRARRAERLETQSPPYL